MLTPENSFSKQNSNTSPKNVGYILNENRVQQLMLTPNTKKAKQKIKKDASIQQSNKKSIQNNNYFCDNQEFEIQQYPFLQKLNESDYKDVSEYQVLKRKDVQNLQYQQQIEFSKQIFLKFFQLFNEKNNQLLELFEYNSAFQILNHQNDQTLQQAIYDLSNIFEVLNIEQEGIQNEYDQYSNIILSAKGVGITKQNNNNITYIEFITSFKFNLKNGQICHSKIKLII